MKINIRIQTNPELWALRYVMTLGNHYHNEIGTVIEWKETTHFLGPLIIGVKHKDKFIRKDVLEKRMEEDIKIRERKNRPV